MKAALLYRIASVLLLLFAIGHSLGFRQNNPEWGVGSVIDSMRSIHFDACTDTPHCVGAGRFDLEIRFHHPAPFSTIITLCLLAAALLAPKKQI